jgi:hypothetical protein
VKGAVSKDSIVDLVLTYSTLAVPGLKESFEKGDHMTTLKLSGRYKEPNSTDELRFFGTVEVRLKDK